MKHFGDERDWFFSHRFGMFVHWGLYAVGGLHEQEQWRYRIPGADYAKYADRFNPKCFDPALWLDLAQDCGMEYLVFTAKHHDGFCMWDSRECDFNVMNTPFQRDILALIAEECHRRNFPLVVYYSVVDWHQPAYPNCGRHHEITTDPAGHDMAAYVEYVKRQLREICSNYGKIHGIWWDMNVPEHVDPSVNAMIRELQPGIIINNRGFDKGDFSTPERDWNDASGVYRTPTEACNSVGATSWGFRRGEDYFSVRYLERQIAENLMRGGNFLLNAGPRPDGTFAPEAEWILRAVGKWYRRVKRGLCAEPLSDKLADKTLLATGGGGTLFVAAPTGFDMETATLAPLTSLPKTVSLLNFSDELSATLEPTPYQLEQPAALRLRKLPVEKLYGEVPVLELTFEGGIS